MIGYDLNTNNDYQLYNDQERIQLITQGERNITNVILHQKETNQTSYLRSLSKAQQHIIVYVTCDRDFI